MTTPTGRIINAPVQTIDGVVRAELYVDGVKVCAAAPMPTTGGAGASGGGAMSVANGADIAEGATTDTEAVGNGSVIAILKRLRTLLSGTLATSRTWTLSSGTDSVAVTGTFFPPTQPVSGTVAVTGAYPATQPVSLAAAVPVTDNGGLLSVDDGGGSLTVDGTVGISGTVPVSGTFYPATQPVSAASLPLPVGAAQDGTDITSPTAMPAGGAGTRGWLSAIWTKLNGTLAVTGTFWQATQPVSGTVTANAGTGTMAVSGPLTDTQLRAAALPVTGSGAAGTPATGVQTVQGIANGTPQNAALTAGAAAFGNLNEIRAATSYATVTAASGAAATLTISAAGAGLFHYITSIEIVAYSAAARTGSATPWVVTTTNITGSPAYTFSTAGAIGTTDVQRPILATPLKVTTANTNTTIVAPAATGVIWRIQVTYFTAT